MKKTILSIFTFVTIAASAQVTNYSLTSEHTAVTVGNSTTITISGSQIGFNYMLRDNSDNSVVTFPMLGTGSSLVFNTGAIGVNTTYNVLASNAITLQFNTNNSTVQFTNDTRTVDQEVTLAAWVRTAGTNGLIRNIIQQYGGTGEDAGYILRLNQNGKVSITGRDQSTNYRSSGESTSTIVNDQWHYIVGTVNVTTGIWSIYVDGTLENSQTHSGGVSLTTTASVLKIGGTFSTSKSIIGDVRDVTIWNKALLASEVMINFSSCITGSENNVVGHFPLNEGQGNEIIDYSSLAINGTNNTGNLPYPWIEESTSCRDSLEMSELITVNVSNDILVNSITVQGQNGSSIIDADFGTLQMEATVLPTNALNGNYTWTVSNGTGSATISSSGILSAENNGTVTVKATANDGSGTNTTTLITISNQTVGINESQLQNVSIYPNPVQNELFVVLEGKQITKIDILDLSGKVIKSVSHNNSKTIDVSELQQGVYVLKVYTQTAVSNTRFIKQ